MRESIINQLLYLTIALTIFTRCCKLMQPSIRYTTKEQNCLQLKHNSRTPEIRNLTHHKQLPLDTLSKMSYQTKSVLFCASVVMLLVTFCLAVPVKPNSGVLTVEESYHVGLIVGYHTAVSRLYNNHKK